MEPGARFLGAPGRAAPPAGAAAWGGTAFRRLLPFLSTEALEKVEALCPRPKMVLAAA